METTLTLEHHSAEAEDLGRHGHQAALLDGLDFVNTLSYDKGETHDGLRDALTAVRWLQRHALLHQEMADTILADAADADGEERLLSRIRRVRGALRELLDAAVEQRPPQSGALKEVNRALRAPYVIELVPAADGVSLDHRHEGDPISGAMARLSEAVTRELTGSNVRRLRVCANEECRWVFNDHSPAGRRKWCDMSSCGNRAKAARHRERQKQKAASETVEQSATA